VSYAATALYVIFYRVASIVLPMGAAGGENLMPRLAAATFGAVILAPGILGLLRLLRVGP
jgi:hypothetical protein